MPRIRYHILPVLVLAVLAAGCRAEERPGTTRARIPEGTDTVTITSERARKIVSHAIEQTTYTHRYDPAYTKLDYPGGDVPRDRGVCSDVVVRAFRACGMDLQKLVHEDMKGAFRAYPNKWGLARPDPNIDHRRVPNLMTWFKRHGYSRPITRSAADYAPGDIVAWELDNGLLHIGLVSHVRSEEAPERLAVIHNIGGGTEVEDVLFAWKIIGHYRVTSK